MPDQYTIEQASASNAYRDDETDNYQTSGWTVVARGQTYDELMRDLLTAFNDEELDSDNSWLRLVEPDGTIRSF
jgi:hypothetical protein